MVWRLKFPLVLSLVCVLVLSACEKPLHDPAADAPLLVPDTGNAQPQEQQPESNTTIALPDPEPTAEPQPEPTDLPAPQPAADQVQEAESADAYPAPSFQEPTATPISLPAIDPTATPIVISAPQQATTIPVPTIAFNAEPTEVPAPSQQQIYPTPNPTWVFEQTRDANSFAQPVPTVNTYIVRGGDTVFGISQIYGVSAEAIAQANGLVDFYIFPGQELIIPAAGTTGTVSGGNGDVAHTVLAGQTLFSIAQSYGVTVETLTAYNGLLDPSVLSVGQVIFIPQ